MFGLFLLRRCAVAGGWVNLGLMTWVVLGHVVGRHTFTEPFWWSRLSMHLYLSIHGKSEGSLDGAIMHCRDSALGFHESYACHLCVLANYINNIPSSWPVSDNKIPATYFRSLCKWAEIKLIGVGLVVTALSTL